MQQGTTFSQLQCEYLGVDYRACFEQLICDPEYQVIRLCGYWNRIELEPGVYQFDELIELLDGCRAHGKRVVLTVGMKAPRWPEFHIPEFYAELGFESQEFREALFAFLDHVCRVATGYRNLLSCIQVENEPFHAYDVNGQRTIPPQLVFEEVRLIREQLPGITIAVTCGLSMTKPFEAQDIRALWYATQVADYIGFNVYVHIGVAAGRYLVARGWLYYQLRFYVFALRMIGKRCFVAEAQDEPWEHGSHVHLDSVEYRSWSEAQSLRLWRSLSRIPFLFVLRWGYEWREARLLKIVLNYRYEN